MMVRGLHNSIILLTIFLAIDLVVPQIHTCIEQPVQHNVTRS
jgi:hypothetical protein